MLRTLKLISGLLVTLALVGCGKPTCYPPTAIQSFGSPTDASDIFMDSSVPNEQQSQLQSDLTLLGKVNLTANEKDSCTVGIKEFTGTSMVQYLKTRVRYLVGEKYDYKKPVITKRDNSQTTIYSSMGTDTVTPSQLSEVVTVMTNVSAYLYLVSRPNSAMLSLNISGTNVPQNSPRDGVIQVGVGMFTANKVPNSATGSTANALLRLAVLLHEARHGDGHGDYAGYPHIICTEGTYKDQAACEKYANGPYSVQATMTRKFIEACTDCTSTERDGMMRLQADYESRIASTAQAEDDRPEGFVAAVAAAAEVQDTRSAGFVK